MSAAPRVGRVMVELPREFFDDALVRARVDEMARGRALEMGGVLVGPPEWPGPDPSIPSLVWLMVEPAISGGAK